MTRAAGLDLRRSYERSDHGDKNVQISIRDGRWYLKSGAHKKGNRINSYASLAHCLKFQAGGHIRYGSSFAQRILAPDGLFNMSVAPFYNVLAHQESVMSI